MPSWLRVRLFLWRVALVLIGERRLTGWGLGGFALCVNGLADSPLRVPSTFVLFFCLLGWLSAQEAARSPCAFQRSSRHTYGSARCTFRPTTAPRQSRPSKLCSQPAGDGAR